MGVLEGFLAAAIRIATPLLFAATGELVTERAGVINLSVEGAMLAGALGSTLGAFHGSPWVGVLCGVAAGLFTALCFALIALGARTDQIITGTAVTLGVIGATGVIYRRAFGAAGAGLSLPTFGNVAIPGLSKIPLVGPGFFNQPSLTYIAWLLVPVVWWGLYRTRWGLTLRATGESMHAARAAGAPVLRIKIVATLFGGAMSGLAGATLVLAQVGTFAERMTGGRGFVAIAIVVLGRWHPVGVLVASVLFGAANALQFAFQAMGLSVPYQLFLMLPYVLALVALAGAVGRTRAPAELGRLSDRR
ncbi:MAG: ABC transporter permease [Gemmatimonadota bacterium]